MPLALSFLYIVDVLFCNIAYLLNVVDLWMFNCIYIECIYICLLHVHVYREAFLPILL